MDKVQELTYQGVAPWMLWVAVVAGVVLCGVIAAVYKVIQISRSEKQHKQEEIQKIAASEVDKNVKSLAEDISEKVMESMKGKFDAIDRRFESIDTKLKADKTRLELAEERSRAHDKSLERIETTLTSVDTNIKDMRKGFTFLARGTVATMNKILHDGAGADADLAKAARGLNDYLTDRPTVPMQQSQNNEEEVNE